MLDYTIFGESHGPAVGVLVTGAAPGLPVDRELITRELQRRAPHGPLATARRATTPLWRTSPAPATPITPPMSAAVAATTPGAAGPIPAA